VPLDDRAALLALRTRALTLLAVDIPNLVFTTEVDEDEHTVIVAPGVSFAGEGLMVGMEIQTDQDSDFVVLAVDGDRLTIDEPRRIENGQDVVAELPTSPVSLTVGAPRRQQWENIPFEPSDGRWYIQEEYLPPPAPRMIAGNFDHGEFDIYPAYLLHLYGLAGSGADALYRVSKVMLDTVFRPGFALPTSDGHVLRTRGGMNPFRGQLVAQGASHATILITIPLWARSFT
jgi:hypothetical protein